MTLIVEPVRFVKKGAHGDYATMVKNSAYDDALFIIAENFMHSMITKRTAGAGTACLRPYTYQFLTKAERANGIAPRAAGVPTGLSINTEGFPFMDDTYTKRIIDLSIERIALILDTYPSIKRVVYSCDVKDPDLIGTSIFADTIGADVVRYISEALRNLPYRTASTMTFEKIRQAELIMYPFAAIHDEHALKVQELTKAKVQIAKLETLLRTKGLVPASEATVHKQATGAKLASSIKKRSVAQSNGNIMTMLRRSA